MFDKTPNEQGWWDGHNGKAATPAEASDSAPYMRGWNRGVRNRESKDIVAAWADAHLTRQPGDSPYALWEKTWILKWQHHMIRLRLCQTDMGADIVLGSCSASYGANEDDWHSANMGHVRTIEPLQKLYDWMETMRALGDIR